MLDLDGSATSPPSVAPVVAGATMRGMAVMRYQRSTVPIRAFACVTLVVLCLGSPISAKADLPPPTSRAVSPAGSEPTAALFAPKTLADLIKVFPRGEVSEGGGRRLLGVRLGEVLQAIARDAGDQEPEVAFVVDASEIDSLALELQFALAGNRDKLTRGRFALIGCGVREHAWSAQVLVPFGTDSYAVVRAAWPINSWTFGSGIGASVAGLAAAARLDWHSNQNRPHIVLLTNDPSPRRILPSDKPIPSATDGATLASVRAWAHASQASLHAILGKMNLHDGREDDTSEDSLAQRSRVTLGQIAGLFRHGRYEKVLSRSEFSSAIERALPQPASDTAGADVALLVNATGLMGEAAGALRGQRAAFDQFLSVKGHRLALVLFFDKGKPVTVLPFTGDKGAMARALRGLHRGPLGDWPKDVSEAIMAAHRLLWKTTARKALIIFTAADSARGLNPSLLGWA
jgi:hypothetical protein